jgi:hypothetical protein
MKNKIKILFIALCFIIIGAGIAIFIQVSAWTNPSQSPSGGGGALYYSNGNVGIGTTAPNSKLEVAGTIHSTTGGIKFPDNTTQTSAGITTFTPISRTNVLSAGGATTWTSVNLSSVVPVSAKVAYITWCTNGNNNPQYFYIGSNSAGTLGQAKIATNDNGGSYMVCGQAQIILTTSQTLYYLKADPSMTDANLYIEVYGYGM